MLLQHKSLFVAEFGVFSSSLLSVSVSVSRSFPCIKGSASFGPHTSLLLGRYSDLCGAGLSCPDLALDPVTPALPVIYNPLTLPRPPGMVTGSAPELGYPVLSLSLTPPLTL